MTSWKDCAVIGGSAASQDASSRTAVFIDTDDGPVEAWIYLGAGRP